jgi:hypothetical protein
MPNYLCSTVVCKHFVVEGRVCLFVSVLSDDPDSTVAASCSGENDLMMIFLTIVGREHLLGLLYCVVYAVVLL